VLSTTSHRLSILVMDTFHDADVEPDDTPAGALAALHGEQGATRLPLRGQDDVELLDFLS
jgi:hypothetical protein